MQKLNDYNDAKLYLQQFGQDHLLSGWQLLSDSEKESLLLDISTLDFSRIPALLSLLDVPAKTLQYTPATIERISSESVDTVSRYCEAGEDALRRGAVACFVVAGGEGSRLGFNGPKGLYSISPVKGKTLFQLFAETIVHYSGMFGRSIPFLIMTSRANHDTTVDYFESNNYFGLNCDDVLIFRQGEISSLDLDGKLILSSPSTLYRNPDGHGGVFDAMKNNGAVDFMKSRGIEYLSFFQVDNPLTRIIDPLALGYHILSGQDVSSKAIMKQHPDEKLGHFVTLPDGRLGIAEYSDIPKEMVYMTAEDGLPLFRWGNCGIYIFSTDFIQKVIAGGDRSMPFHLARKQVQRWTSSGTEKIDAFKFEKFVFDSIPFAEHASIIETERAEEFSPVKNAEGEHSPGVCRKMMSDLFKSWCISRGISVPSGVKQLEISPLVACSAEELPSDTVIPNEENCYIG